MKANKQPTEEELEAQNNDEQFNNQDNTQDNGDNEGGQDGKKYPSKEENFDGVVKKLNKVTKELRTLRAENEMLKAIGQSPTKQDENAENSLAETVKSLQTKLETIENESKVERLMANINQDLAETVDKKYIQNGVAKTLLDSIANSNGLDLSDSTDRQAAIDIFNNEYPEFISKKPRKIGVPNVTDEGERSVKEIVESGDTDYFYSLSKEEQAKFLAKLKKLNN